MTLSQRSRLEFGREWALLEQLCLMDPADGPQALEELLSPGLDWGEVLDHALRHRMLTLLAHTLVSQGLLGAVPLRVGEHLRTVLLANLHRREVWYGEAARVTTALEQAGITVAVRKGAAYESDLYGGNGSRWLGDIDILADGADSAQATEVMRSLGYEAGLYDFDTDTIVPFDRSELIRYRLNPDHSPTMSRRTGDLLNPVVEVDFAYSLTWARSGYQVPVQVLLESVNRHPVPGFPGMALPRTAARYLFLDTVLHLFREAWVEWWLDKEQDVDLMKFGDVVRLCRTYEKEVCAPDLLDELGRWGVVEPVCWVLEHMDRALGTRSAQALGLEGRVGEDFLASAGRSEGTQRSWDGDMRSRLHSKNRRHLFRRTATEDSGQTT